MAGSEFATRPRWVAGLLFHEDLSYVALVRKNRPKWQAGRLNAIGGSVEEGETAFGAMVREFKEEAGVEINDWKEFAWLYGDWGTVVFYRAFKPSETLLKVRTMEDEEIIFLPTDYLPYDEMIPNLSWIIPLAMYRHDDYHVIKVQEKK